MIIFLDLFTSSPNTNAGLHVKDVLYAWNHDPGGNSALLEQRFCFLENLLRMPLAT